jgi:uncharacterized protein YdaU (DUF1376 family)
MSKSPSVQWYPKDILSSLRVQMMTLTEEGAYRRLLDFCWINGAIPADPEKAARVVGKGCTKEIAKVCLEMFTPHPTDESLLVHDRQEIERAKQLQNSEVRKKAADARWKNQGKPADVRGKQETPTDSANFQQTDANAMQMDMQNDALHTSSSSSIAIKEKEETIVSSKKKKGSRIPKDFYPSDEMLEWAKQTIPGINLEARILEFKNYWEAKTGKDATKLDWEKTFQNRILQIAEYQGNGTVKQPIINGNKPPSAASIIANRPYRNQNSG